MQGVPGSTINHAEQRHRLGGGNVVRDRIGRTGSDQDALGVGTLPGRRHARPDRQLRAVPRRDDSTDRLDPWAEGQWRLGLVLTAQHQVVEEVEPGRLDSHDILARACDWIGEVRQPHPPLGGDRLDSPGFHCSPWISASRKSRKTATRFEFRSSSG